MLVDEHCEALTADLPRYYPGTRLADLFTGRLSFYELGALITHLPAESAYRTARRDAYTDEQLAGMGAPDSPHGAWSHSDLLLAAIFDAIMALTHVQMARAGVKQDPPEPMRRPGIVSRRRHMSPQAIEYLEKVRQRNQELREAGNG